jgi:1-deoxy-D-xylulose-5-phosphate reductoisomerase
MKKKVAILGSTGSVGKQTLEVLEYFPEQYEIFAISAYKNKSLFINQINKYKPKLVGIFEDMDFIDLNQTNKFETFWGALGICQIASHPLIDIVIVAIPGSNSIAPAWAATVAGKTIGMASKEAMVMVGPQIISLAKNTGANILPIDSELGTLWQAIHGDNISSIRKAYITCSGGAFMGYKPEKIMEANISDVLKHPTWTMGTKITIDSATLMNKALEVIESFYLFDFRLDQIEVILHPESYVHSMIEYQDGSIRANIGVRDMRLFIQSILSYPACSKGPAKFLDWTNLPPLTFELLSSEKIPALKMAYYVCKSGGTYPAVFCSSNDEAVKMFLEGKIKFHQIVDLIANVLDKHINIQNPTYDDIVAMDSWAKSTVRRVLI